MAKTVWLRFIHLLLCDYCVLLALLCYGSCQHLYGRDFCTRNFLLTDNSLYVVICNSTRLDNLPSRAAINQVETITLREIPSKCSRKKRSVGKVAISFQKRINFSRFSVYHFRSYRNSSLLTIAEFYGRTI